MSSAPPTQTIGIDWSGARDVRGQRRAIWCAVVREGELAESEDGRTREEVLAHALALAGEHAGPTAIGLDFAFGLPAWWVNEAGVADLWAWARERRETRGPTWTEGQEAPFWYAAAGAEQPPLLEGSAATGTPRSRRGRWGRRRSRSSS